MGKKRTPTLSKKWQQILETAARLASIRGLDSISISDMRWICQTIISGQSPYRVLKGIMSAGYCRQEGDQIIVLRTTDQLGRTPAGDDGANPITERMLRIRAGKDV